MLTISIDELISDAKRFLDKGGSYIGVEHNGDFPQALVGRLEQERLPFITIEKRDIIPGVPRPYFSLDVTGMAIREARKYQ